MKRKKLIIIAIENRDRKKERAGDNVRNLTGFGSGSMLLGELDLDPDLCF